MSRAAPLLAALALAACSAQSLRPRQTGADEVAALAERLLELERQVTVHELEIGRLRQRLAELEALPAAAPRREPARPAPPPTAAPPRPAEARPAPPPAPGSAGRAPHLEEEELPAEPVRPVTPPAPAPAGRPEVAERGAPVDAAAQALYDQGYALYHQGRYVDSESTFRRFLQTYGATELGDNAAYWIGEARFARGDHRGALAAFREAVERYPEGNKVPDSLLKVGRCLEELGDGEGARDVYTEVIRRFPGSAAAATAEERQTLLP